MNKNTECLAKAYGHVKCIEKFLKTPFLLFVRLYWGYMFLLAGWGKLSNIQKPIGFFTELGIPFPQFNAYLASTTEFVGGALLILGLGSRLVTIPLAFTMLVAYWTADHAALLSIFSEPEKFYGAAPFTFLMAS